MKGIVSRRSFLIRARDTAAATAFIPVSSPLKWIGAMHNDFNLAIGVCTSVSNATLLREAGCAYLEAGVRRLLVPDRSEAEFEQLRGEALNCGLPVRACNSFLPGEMKSTGPEADHERVLAFAAVACERAARVGVETIVFGSGGSRSVPEGFEPEAAVLQFVSLLERMGPLAARHGITIAIEPLQSSECNFINTVREGAEIVRLVNHPHIRLLADIYHMMREDEGPEAIREAGDLLVHLHVAERDRRTPPGTAGDSFLPWFRALAGIGYEGWLSIECRWDDLAGQLPRAVSTLQEQMSEVT
jgi:sugar phosphate isomerase/epimerase